MHSGAGLMDEQLERWFARRTWQQPTWSVEQLRLAKHGRRVSVVAQTRARDSEPPRAHLGHVAEGNVNRR